MRKFTLNITIIKWTMIFLVLALVVGLLLTYPRSEKLTSNYKFAKKVLYSGDQVKARVVQVSERNCNGSQDKSENPAQCLKIQALLLEGKGKDTTVRLEQQAIETIKDRPRRGDEVYLSHTRYESQDQYFLIGKDYSKILILALGIFLCLLIWAGRMQGIRAFLGLLLSLLLVWFHTVPALLADQASLFVCYMDAIAIMVITIVVSHGWKLKAHLAIIATWLSISVAFGAIYLISYWAGFSVNALFDYELITKGSASGILPLYVGAVIITAIGILDDITVSQVSTVLALYKTKPDIDQESLYKRGMEVGRDHIGAIVNTLALAYLGSNLTLLLVMGMAPNLGDLFRTNQIVVGTILALILGTLALLLAMPLSTRMAAWSVARLQKEELLLSLEQEHLHDHGHGHDHGYGDEKETDPFDSIFPPDSAPDLDNEKAD